MISNDIAMGTPYLDRIEGLFYEPWVGPGFAESELRIFLLGDSHYDSDEKFDHTVTHAVVNLHGKRGYVRFMNGCRHLVSGLPNDLTDPVRFWDTVAFANLLQVQLSEARSTGNWSDYLQGAKLFEEVVEISGPTHIVAFGDRVWNALEAAGSLHEPSSDDGFYRGVLRGVPLYYSRHPSGAFSWTQWALGFGAFLKQTRVRRDTVEKFVGRFRSVPTSVLLETYDGGG